MKNHNNARTDTNRTRRRFSEKAERLRRKAGRWLKALRIRRSLSQSELSKLVGASQSSFVSQIEIGKQRLPPEKYVVWAEALGMPAKDFVLELIRYYDPDVFSCLNDATLGAAASTSQKTRRHRGQKVEVSQDSSIERTR